MLIYWLPFEKIFSSWGPGEFVFYAKNCTRVQKIEENFAFCIDSRWSSPWLQVTLSLLASSRSERARCACEEGLLVGKSSPRLRSALKS